MELIGRGVLEALRLLQVAEAAQVFRAPASEEIARFVGVETILDCRVVDRAGPLAILELGGQTLQVAQPAEPGEWSPPAPMSALLLTAASRWSPWRPSAPWRIWGSARAPR